MAQEPEDTRRAITTVEEQHMAQAGMNPKPEDTQREIARLRGDMTSTVDELEQRVRGGVPGVLGADARVSGARAGQQAAEQLRENTGLVGVGGVVAAAAVTYGAYAAFRSWRNSRKPQNRLKGKVRGVREEIEERVGEGRDRLRELRQRGVLLKMEPEGGGYMRVTDARLDALNPKKGDRTAVLKKLLWAVFLSIFMALGSVLARRAAGGLWRATLREDPPTEQPKAKA